MLDIESVEGEIYTLRGYRILGTPAEPILRPTVVVVRLGEVEHLPGWRWSRGRRRTPK